MFLLDFASGNISTASQSVLATLSMCSVLQFFLDPSQLLCQFGQQLIDGERIAITVRPTESFSNDF
jgi:hypothetical protein